MLYLVAERFTHCSWIRGMTVRGHLFRRMANNSESLLEKLLGCLHISLFAQLRIHQIAISINGPIEIAPFSLNLDIRLINIPGSSCLPVSFYSQLICEQRGKSCFPIANRLMREGETSL